MSKTLAEILPGAFLTCESGEGEYKVVAKFATLEESQEFHESMVILRDAALRYSESKAMLGRLMYPSDLPQNNG